jgi:hypothetical protein
MPDAEDHLSDTPFVGASVMSEDLVDLFDTRLDECLIFAHCNVLLAIDGASNVLYALDCRGEFRSSSDQVGVFFAQTRNF